MHREYGGYTARTGGDGMRDETRQTLHPEEDLADGTVSRVDDYSGDRIHQRLICQISVILRDFTIAEWHGEVIEHSTTIHKERAYRHETTAEFRVPNHDDPILVIPCVHPIVLDVLDTSTNIIFAKDQRGIFNNGHQTETQWSGELQGIISVLYLERHIGSTGYEQEANKTGANYVY